MKILVVEDEPEMRDNIAHSLRQDNYVVETAHDFFSAKEKLNIYQYDCILLDIGLPGGNGLQLLEDLKKDSVKAGIIIVSAKGSIDDRVSGLNLGADDYLPKPFHMAELHARVNSLVRRKTLGGSAVLEINNLRINTEERTLKINDVDIPLNRKEFDTLLYLATNKNRLVNKTALAEHVWGDYIDEANSFDFIYSQIKNLRKKLKDGKAQVEINAIYGIGYKLVDA